MPGKADGHTSVLDCAPSSMSPLRVGDRLLVAMSVDPIRSERVNYTDTSKI
jgi:hypothetical protein